jgi:Secretion system C-terminal sorting domain
MVFDEIDEAQGSFSFVDIEALNLVGEFLETSELFIDDIVYSALPEAKSLEEPLKEELNLAFATVSPNPASEKILLTPDSKTEDAWQVQVLNSVGQVVLAKKSVGATPFEIDVHDVKAGLYILEFQSDNTRWAKKIVVQH